VPCQSKPSGTTVTVWRSPRCSRTSTVPALSPGYYHFNIFPDGKPDVWVARYTFVFEKKDGNWMILHQHSSRVPNLTAAPAR
jgi:hypothetical protein